MLTPWPCTGVLEDMSRLGSIVADMSDNGGVVRGARLDPQKD